MLIKLARNLTGGVNRLNPLIMRGNIRYLDLTSKVHLKGALGYISLGGSGGRPAGWLSRLVLSLPLSPRTAQPIPPGHKPAFAPKPISPTTKSVIGMFSHNLLMAPSTRPPSASPPVSAPRPPTQPAALPQGTMVPSPTTRHYMSKMRPAPIFLSAVWSLVPFCRVRHTSRRHRRLPHSSLQLHFYLLSLPLLAVFLLIGLTETKAKKGFNGTSLTNFNISPRIALWR